MAGLQRWERCALRRVLTLLLFVLAGLPGDTQAQGRGSFHGVPSGGAALPDDQYAAPRLQIYSHQGVLSTAAFYDSMIYASFDPVQLPYDRPVLIVDPGAHAAPINAASVDAAGRLAVTGSDDKTVRIWSISEGTLLQTIRVPAGGGDAGKIYAVAISPDGKLVAAGGHTLGSTEYKSYPIYLFDLSTGRMIQRIADDLRNDTRRLIFSADGRYLAAAVGGFDGLRVYDRDKNWSEAFRDDHYDGSSHGVAFDKNGRLATTSLSGSIRLYDNHFKLIHVKETTNGHRPWGLAFKPDGKLLAVGYHDVAAVDLLDAETWAAVPPPTTTGLKKPLPEVAWSADGSTLLAGGLDTDDEDTDRVFAWPDGGHGKRRTMSVGHATITSIVGLSDNQVLVAAADPYLAVLEANGTSRWAHDRPSADFRGQQATLSVSPDGMTVAFYFARGKFPLLFDVRGLSLSGAGVRDNLAPPKQDGLLIAGWDNGKSPTVNGNALQLDNFDVSKSLSIHPDGKRFAIGTAWSLQTFDAEGKLLWRRIAPGQVWAVNITGDGRIVVAAYSDGTIRWHRMDDGRELLALTVLSDKQNWVAWTPEGFYAATTGAYGALRWHVNHGLDAVGTTIPASSIPKLRRPDALPLVLQELETARGLGIADVAAARHNVQVATGTANPPGTRLHLLTIGINDYGTDAKRLRLDFASKDASDVLSALVNTQDGKFNKLGRLYAEVIPTYLHDEEATKGEVYEALNSMQRNMARSTGEDLAVVMFSGHSAMLGGQFYLLPYGVNATTSSRLEATAIPAMEFQGKLAELATHGRVLVLLDACHSGAVTGDGEPLTPNADRLRSSLVASNVTVLASSKGNELSRADPQWNNGAFAKALLEALGRAADTDHNGMISMSELTAYLSARVPALTGGRQHVGIEQGFQRELFVAGL
jgi:WD40 repeat protein